MEEVGRASEAKEEDGSGGADENNGRITSKAQNAAVNGRGACEDVDSGAAGWRRSAEPPRPWRRTAAGRMETVEMKGG
jgi:hypothetical protein